MGCRAEDAAIFRAPKMKDSRFFPQAELRRAMAHWCCHTESGRPRTDGGDKMFDSLHGGGYLAEAEVRARQAAEQAQGKPVSIRKPPRQRPIRTWLRRLVRRRKG
ncbi:hypothetical protein GCM10010196_08180 [Agromyces mediolanus]|uniref:Uncharacterized protein n=1 Tax=Agromyces mediolanus TaxID=41986 RepID=A0A918CET0_AGRME|nr:hypothetical protein GCM10010196_08180 [Agromyces mediolanus]GLJ71570.1 hypothetical protein GCM10017583_08260 [Agromyces mediolanus]